MTQEKTFEERVNQAEVELAQALKEEGQKERLYDIPLLKIVRDKKLQPRVGVKTETVERYAELYRDEPKKLPPIRAFYDSHLDCYWVYDGWTRTEALESLGPLFATTIPGIIKEGTREDAIIAAAGANAEHGEPRTRDDQVRAIRNLLSEVPSYRPKSDREIARVCHLQKESGHKQVARVYQKMVDEGLIPPRPETREGADGKERKAPTGSMTQLKEGEAQPSLLISSPSQRTGPGLFDQIMERKDELTQTRSVSGAQVPQSADAPQSGLSSVASMQQPLGDGGSGSERTDREMVAEHPQAETQAQPQDPQASREEGQGNQSAASITYVDYNTGDPVPPKKEASDPIAESVEASFEKSGELDAKTLLPKKNGGVEDSTPPRKKWVKVTCSQCKGAGTPKGGHGPCYVCRGKCFIEMELFQSEPNGNGEKNQHYNTPPEIRDPLKPLTGEFGLDPCTNDGSILGALKTINEKQDGLSDKWDWTDLAKGHLIPVNPPYNNISPWVDRVILEAAKGANEVLIVPNRSDADWHHKASDSCKLMAVVKGRVNFLRNGDPDKNPTEATILFYWGNQPGRFAAIAKSQGWRVTQDLSADMFSGAVATLKEEEAKRRQVVLPLAEPQSEAKEAEAGDPRVSRALLQLKACSTCEEFDETYLPLWIKAMTSEERSALVAFKEEHRGKLPHRDNVKAPLDSYDMEVWAKEGKVKREGYAFTQEMKTIAVDKKDLKEWLEDGRLFVRFAKWYEMGEAKLKTCSTLTQALKVYDGMIEAARTEDERIKAYTLLSEWKTAHQPTEPASEVSHKERALKEFRKCNYVAQGTKVFDRLTFEAKNAKEKEAIKDAFAEWKKTKPASRPYNAKASKPITSPLKKKTTAPKPLRNKGKNEEKRTPKKVAKR